MKKFFMAVIAIMMTVSVSAQFYIYLSNGDVLKADSISMVAPSTPNPPTPSGDSILSGAFSVGENTQVHFSQGNLQYQASTDTWRFAENQYDMIGSANSNISASYSGWIDLFGWGTGNNPTNSSEFDGDYATFNDWGNNMGEGWRTLSTDEWVYLFYGRTDAAQLFGMGSINGVKGTILLPDNWVTPDGASFTPSTSQVLEDQGGYYGNPNGQSFTHNTYTVEQWSVMETAGAVFLPAAGCRPGRSVGYVGEYGSYWSATPGGGGSEYNAYFMYFFYSVDLTPQEYNGRHMGQSVRLVR